MSSDQREWTQWLARVYKRWRWVTFLPPEDVRSGFTDSAFSLLDDLDLLPFSFSADSGDSEGGLALFLKESGKRSGQFSAAGCCTGWGAVLDIRTGSIFVLFAFGFLARLALIGRMVLKGSSRERQRVRAERALLKGFGRCSGGLCLIKTNTVIRGGGEGCNLKH